MADYTAEERARQIVTLALHRDDTTLAAATLNTDTEPALVAAYLVGMLVATVRDAALLREMDAAAYWAMVCERNTR